MTVKKMYMTADEVAEVLGVSRGYAYKVIKNLNDELHKKGYTIISGKVSTVSASKHDVVLSNLKSVILTISFFEVLFMPVFQSAFFW